MEIRYSIIESFEKQGLLLSDKPEVIDALERMYSDIMDGNSLKAAPIDIGKSIFGEANIIPSNERTSCKKILISFCYDKDNFEDRIFESLNHATLQCGKASSEIFFLTTYWESSVINKLRGYVEAVRRNGVSVNFIYGAEKGYAIMPE